MRTLLVAGNWKMHGSRAMTDSLVNGLLSELENLHGFDVAVFPPAPYLSQVQELADGSRIAWGGQTLNPNAQGAFTGEVSGGMLADFGCRYVLVGHSERRSLFGESDADVADRFAAALEAGLEPVLCLGESLEEREAGDTERVVARQLDAVIDRCGIEGLGRGLLAYEPVWAIGTGLTATPEQAQNVHAFLRGKLTGLDGMIGGQIRILYGGSVKASNAADLFARDDIDGALVGGASLTVEDFIGICRAATA
ncbi:MAG: triose-phosphate isomerase [Xanthomonadales bacterium]|jgi:triosephosphate isomerase|nr:triose-phosphate isomerase [Xanthomonadales bacterium]